MDDNILPVYTAAVVFPHAEFERVPRQTFLHADGAADGFLDSRKFGEKPIARVFDDATRMFGYRRINDVGASG